MRNAQSLAPLLGRLILAWFFLTQAYRYGLDWNSTAILLSMKHLPIPSVLVLVALIAAVAGSLALVLGFFTRVGALALFALTVAATLALHDYWHLRAIEVRNADYDMFARNLAIAGGLLLLIGMGPGRFAMDNLNRKVAGSKAGRGKQR
jgi:putative oxidoreductase